MMVLLLVLPCLCCMTAGVQDLSVDFESDRWEIQNGKVTEHLGRKSFMPLPTEWEIIDDYLTAVTVFLELGVEGYYARANREAFG